MGIYLAREAFILRYKTYRNQWIVDLKPGQRQEEYIMGNEISESHVGHVLLDADYRLKHRYNELLDPDTEEGFLFWANVQKYWRFWDGVYCGPIGKLLLIFCQYFVGYEVCTEFGDSLYFSLKKSGQMLSQRYWQSFCLFIGQQHVDKLLIS